MVVLFCFPITMEGMKSPKGDRSFYLSGRNELSICFKMRKESGFLLQEWWGSFFRVMWRFCRLTQWLSCFAAVLFHMHLSHTVKASGFVLCNHERLSYLSLLSVIAINGGSDSERTVVAVLSREKVTSLQWIVWTSGDRRLHVCADSKLYFCYGFLWMQLSPEACVRWIDPV